MRYWMKLADHGMQPSFSCARYEHEEFDQPTPRQIRVMLFAATPTLFDRIRRSCGRCPRRFWLITSPDRMAANLVQHGRPRSWQVFHSCLRRRVLRVEPILQDIVERKRSPAVTCIMIKGLFSDYFSRWTQNAHANVDAVHHLQE